MNENEKIDTLREKINDAEAIIVGGASGMSAASGFRFYYADDDVFKNIAGGIRDKYRVYTYFDAYYDPRISREEHWAMMLRTIKYGYECETGETYSDLAELLQGKNYYIVTTNQDAQFFRVFSDEKITRLQGDSRYFQCKSRCHDVIYYNKEQVMQLYEEICEDTLPAEFIPRCPYCGGDMCDWVRSREFLQGKEYRHEYQRYIEFLKAHIHKKTLFLELGVGMMTPMFIKEPFMNMVYQWSNAFYATVNPQHAIIPKEIAAKSIAINDDIAFTLKRLLNKPTGHLKRDKQSEIFNPKRIY